LQIKELQIKELQIKQLQIKELQIKELQIKELLIKTFEVLKERRCPALGVSVAFLKHPALPGKAPQTKKN
jgi:hypothetical protein